MSRAVYGSVKAAVIDGFEQGLTTPQIAAKTGFKPKSIRAVADFCGIILRKAKRGRKPGFTFKKKLPLPQ